MEHKKTPRTLRAAGALSLRPSVRRWVWPTSGASPNKMGSNGGGAFLLIYLLFVFIFSYVGLPAEFAMGRRAATGTLGAYENAWDTRSKSAGKVGGLLGWLPLAGSLCIAIGYAVIVTLCAQGSGGFPAGHTADHRHRRLVRRVFLHPPTL